MDGTAMTIQQQDDTQLARIRRKRAVRGILSTVAGLVVTAAVAIFVVTHALDVDKETLSLIAQYDGTQGAVLDSADQYSNDYRISKDGVMHSCKSMPIEDLRQFKPIQCKDGTVITKK